MVLTSNSGARHAHGVPYGPDPARGNPGSALAQQTLRYNYEYVCNGERVVVGHCRADSDIPGSIPTRPESNNCDVYYPDRPRKPNASEIPVTVLRSNVINMLDACGALGSKRSASVSHAKAAPAGAVQVPPPTQPAKAQAGPPSIGQAQKPFCDQILQLKTLAPGGFRSIDLGQMKGVSASIHASSLELAHGECQINDGFFFSCGWVGPSARVDALFREIGQSVADCLHLPSDLQTYGDGTSIQDLETSHVLYHLQTWPTESAKETELDLSVSYVKP